MFLEIQKSRNPSVAGFGDYLSTILLLRSFSCLGGPRFREDVAANASVLASGARNDNSFHLGGGNGDVLHFMAISIPFPLQDRQEMTVLVGPAKN